MAMSDEGSGAALTLIEGDGGTWSPPMAAPACDPRDWQSLYGQAHARAETDGRGRTRRKRTRKSCAGQRRPPVPAWVR